MTWSRLGSLWWNNTFFVFNIILFEWNQVILKILDKHPALQCLPLICWVLRVNVSKQCIKTRLSPLVDQYLHRSHVLWSILREKKYPRSQIVIGKISAWKRGLMWKAVYVKRESTESPQINVFKDRFMSHPPEMKKYLWSFFREGRKVISLSLVYIVSPTQHFEQVIGWLESSFAKWSEGPAGHEVEHEPVVFCDTKRANDILGCISSNIAIRSRKAILPFSSALLRSVSSHDIIFGGFISLFKAFTERIWQCSSVHTY